MEMMSAVLDSNFGSRHMSSLSLLDIRLHFSPDFWALPMYVFHKLALSLFGGTAKYGTKLMSSEKDGQRILGSMIYGITCFSLFFSLVGTVLGGIWADQSWGDSGVGMPKRTVHYS